MNIIIARYEAVTKGKMIWGLVAFKNEISLDAIYFCTPEFIFNDEGEYAFEPDKNWVNGFIEELHKIVQNDTLIEINTFPGERLIISKDKTIAILSPGRYFDLRQFRFKVDQDLGLTRHRPDGD